MRYMMIVKASAESESGVMPAPEAFVEMNRYNEELVKAGVLLAGEGLTASSGGARVVFAEDGSSTVVDGPFAETKELVAGFWIIQVSSREEALEWARRAPFREGALEVRKIFDEEDFGDALPQEVKESEARMRRETEQRA